MEKITDSSVLQPICSEAARIARISLLVSLWLLGLPASGMDKTDLEFQHMQQLNGAAPDFMLRDASGKELHLAELRGHPVILHFWATWCAPCRKELPQFEVIARDFSPGGVVLVAVSIDDIMDAARIRQYARDLGVTFTVYIASEGDISKSYWSWGVPVTYLIDPTGLLVARSLGPQDWSSVSMHTLISQFVAPMPLKAP